ncbi:MAG: hypothetical protein EOO45_29460 [Flavobacterium sp.]|nr:MAG: hypothetical protein EOO45_29460 [Flavobacterium sp.]
MRNIITALLLLTGLISFAQKKNVSSGYITFNSGTTLEFKNLSIDDENVTYFSEAGQREMKFSKSAVKKIVDSSGAVVFESDSLKAANKARIAEHSKGIMPMREKTDKEKLSYKSGGRVFLNGKKLDNKNAQLLFEPAGLYDDYREGRNTAILGKILLGGGIGLFVGGGISNLAKANKNQQGTPAFLIAGIVAATVAIPIKISGRRKIKDVINQYNQLPKKVDNSTGLRDTRELKFVGNTSGIGFQLQF